MVNEQTPRRLSTLVGAWWRLALGLWLCLVPASARAAPLHVLFIGNSYTYVNNLPRMVAALGEANGVAIATRAVARGGYTLEMHVAEGVDRQLAGADVVVLQEQSRRPIDAPEKLVAAAKALAARAHARLVFFAPWALSGKGAEQRAIDTAYEKAAQVTGGRVAHVGDAWQRAFRERPGLALHLPDGSHPAPEGSYLAALVLFEAVTGKAPAKLPAEILGPTRRIDGDEDQPRAVLVRLPEGELDFLRAVAQ